MDLQWDMYYEIAKIYALLLWSKQTQQLLFTQHFIVYTYLSKAWHAPTKSQ